MTTSATKSKSGEHATPALSHSESQENGEKKWKTFSPKPWDTASTITDSVDIDSYHRQPTTIEGESVIFHPENMMVDFPHIFRFLDHYMVVVKSDDETLNVYYLENPQPRE